MQVASRSATFLVFAVVALFASFATAQAGGGPPQPLTDCDPATKQGNYYLDADLDCGGSGEVTLGTLGATLELRGFAIRNATIAVHCHRRCEIIGPGTIESSGSGIDGYNVEIYNVTVTDIATQAVRVLRKLTIDGSVIQNSATGVQAPRKATISNSQITGNRGDGIRGFGVIDGECVGGNLKLFNTTVTDNNTNPGSQGTSCYDPNNGGCADIRACERAPRLDATSSCGTSLSVFSSTPFGICSLD